MEKAKNELAVQEENNFIVPQGGMEVDAEELDGLTLTFDKVRIPSGGNQMWELPGETNDEAQYSKEIEAVIVDHYPVNAYFESEYNGQAQPPACSSMDGKYGVGEPGGACANCPLNKYGSADDGKGKKCKNLRRIYILRSGEILPMLITLPPTSIRNFADYISKKIVTKGMKACDVVTKFTLSVEKSQTGIKYSKVQFAVSRILNPAEKKVMRSFSEGIKQTTRLQRVDESDIVEE